ncbi:MAG: acyl--CoA ligase [Bacilli bacterium]|nr:acyl--CoA ligase [Bacilli bacterium]
MENSIYAQFAFAAKTWPKNLAMRFENRTWNYVQLKREIDLAARKMSAIGIKKGDVVAMSMPNCSEAVFLLYGLNKIGAISYNIHPMTPPPMMQEMMRKSGSKVLMSLSLSAANYRKALPSDIRVLSINPYKRINLIKYLAVWAKTKRAHGIENYWKIKPSKEIVEADVKGSDPCVYLNTGGTNGEPKIVVISNDTTNFVALRGYDLIKGPREEIRMLTAIPLFHTFGLEMGVHTLLVGGMATVLQIKFNTKEAINHIKKAHSTCIVAVPAIFNALLSRDSFYGPWLKKQNVSFVGGDSIAQSLLDRWNNAMKEWDSDARLYEGYGLTETMSAVNINTKFNHKRGTIGKPLPDVDELIVDPETREILPPNTEGEILISGGNIMSGYLNSDELNKEVFVNINGKKYLSTKDFGMMDEDGYLIFRQRMRRIVKINGETLCPSDVEQVATAIPDIYEAYCYGVPHVRKGHVFHLALVIRRGDHPADKAEVEKAVKEDIERKLPPAYMPEKIVFLDKLPKTPLCKIDDSKLRDLAGEPKAEE